MSAQTPERLNVQTPAICATKFLLALVQGMVSKPDEAAVYWTEENGCLLVDVEVAPEDMGRLIGTRGVHARAIQTLLNAVGAQSGVPYQLNLGAAARSSR